MNRIILEFENEIYWIYDSTEKDLLFYTDDIKELSVWVKETMSDK
jgi:hypothetical protein